MTDFIPYATPTGPRVANNRRGWLIFFGVILILLAGLGWLVAIPLLKGLLRLLRLRINGQLPLMRLYDLLVMLLFSVSMAALLTWAGIDSIRCKRWVRPVALGVGWPVLIVSTLMLTGWLLMARDYGVMFQLPPGSYQMRMLRTFSIVVSLFMGMFGVLIPGACVLFYSRGTVARTLGAYDPAPSWTQRVPLPVFILAVDLLLMGLAVLVLAPLGRAPVFGWWCRGDEAFLLTCFTGLMMIAAAVGCYLRRMAGWLLALLTLVGGFASALMTLTHLGMVEFYRQAELPGDLVQALANSPTMSGRTPVVFVAIAMAISVGYLGWTHRYFRLSWHRRACDESDPPRSIE